MRYQPLMAVSIVNFWLFFVRTVDRIGKGLRTRARDAVLSAISQDARIGAVHINVYMALLQLWNLNGGKNPFFVDRIM